MPYVDDDEEKIRWFFVCAYVADTVGLLDKTKRLKLAHLAEQYAGDESWRSIVERDMGIKKKLVAALYKASVKHLGSEKALCFILRGFGCPYSEARVQDIIGDEIN